MPKIFTKDAKVNVIEYGDQVCMKKEMQCTMQSISSFFRKIFKRPA